ncbi:MAG: hypothetical protein NVSMB9_27300 [Isosphaeraceae bacterium]
MKKDQLKVKLNKTRIATQRGYQIYTVNSFGIRDLTEADEEFTNFAIHGDFPELVPEHEIWIDERLFESEGLFYLANALTQLREQEKGTPSSRAYVAGIHVERMLRERLVGVKFRAARPHKRVPDRVYEESYTVLPDLKHPVEVWLIDGNLARSFYKTDYTEGGHGYVYRWVPKREIWVERDLDRAELPYIIAHEYIEMRLMRDRGLEYDPAHAISAEMEYELREGGEFQSSILPQGGRFTKRDLPRLTTPEFFDLVVKRQGKKKKK